MKKWPALLFTFLLALTFASLSALAGSPFEQAACESDSQATSLGFSVGCKSMVKASSPTQEVLPMRSMDRERERHNRHLDDYFDSHPEDREHWFATKEKAQLPLLYELLVEDDRFGVTDLVTSPEPHKTYLSWHLCGFPQKSIPSSQRTFTLKVNPDFQWGKLRRMKDGKEVMEEEPRLVQFERAMKRNERKLITIKEGQQVTLPANFAYLAMDLYGPAAPLHDRNKLIEVREDEFEPVIAEPTTSGKSDTGKATSPDSEAEGSTSKSRRRRSQT